LFFSVFPAKAGIQLCLFILTLALDAGMCRHDGISLGVKAKDFNHPERNVT